MQINTNTSTVDHDNLLQAQKNQELQNQRDLKQKMVHVQEKTKEVAKLTGIGVYLDITS